MESKETEEKLEEEDWAADSEEEMRSGFAPARSGWEVSLTALALTLFILVDTARKPTAERGIERPQFVTAPPAPSPPAAPLLSPVTGRKEFYVVRKGDTLFSIARAHKADSVTLARLNHLAGERVKPGQALLLPTLHILPRMVSDGLVLNVPERGVYLFRQGRCLARYPVAVGMRTWETPVGAFRLVRKVINPIWVPPKVMVEREGISSADVAPGQNNPLGDRWMGWSAPEVGFHSTYAVQSVGALASHACVRLYPENAHSLFSNTTLGMPIYSVYEPIKIGQRGKDCCLSVSPDVYARNRPTFEKVQQKLKKAGAWESADKQQIRKILAEQDGYPHPIGPLPANAPLR